MVKENHRNDTSLNFDKKLFSFVQKDNKKVKILWGDCLDTLKKLPSESVHLMVTSPPLL